MSRGNSPIVVENREALQDAIQSHHARVAVIGLGYVGLPMAIAFAEAGFMVYGIDTSRERCNDLAEGQSYIVGVTNDEIINLTQSGRFQATSDFDCLSIADIILICVPTPLRKSKDPDLSYILAASEATARHIRPGQLIVLESTTYPGTTEEVLLPLFEKPYMTVGEDFFLAFSPERVDPGNPNFNVRNITKLVGGVTEECAELAAAFYRQIVSEVVIASNTRVAEAAKLLENTFRSVNIGLVNEMAIICKHLEIDVWEVIAAASTKPFAFMPHYPGPGLGGHCIPLDPHYLSWKARLAGYEPRFISLATEVNTAMPRYVVNLITEALNDQSRGMRGSQVLLLGVAYKRNVNDLRESPALDIFEILLKRGARINYCDPYIPEVRLDNQLFCGRTVTPELLQQSDCVVILTDHSDFDYELIVKHSKVVVDTRNASRNFAHQGNVHFL